MGAKLCTLRHLPHATLSEHDDTKEDGMLTKQGASFADVLKPRCLKIEKQKKKIKHQKIIPGKDGERTLEECLLSSPGFEIDSPFRRPSPKVCPLSCSYDHLSQPPRESFSCDVVVVEVEERRGLVSLSRKSGNRKKVSFKIPEKDGIHTIHTHDDLEECVN